MDIKAKFCDLWHVNEDVLARAYPDTTGIRPYDTSSADMALACHLAFWTGKNCERMRALMEQSALRHDKWNRADYLHRTITRACAMQKNVYSAATKQDIEKSQGQPHKTGFKFIPVSQIINNLKAAQWLINGYIEQHTMSLIFGDPASGKSFVAINKACCIATGTPWHGHDVTQGAVFYIAGEGHNGLGRRFKAWEKHNGISLENASLYIAERPAQLYNEDSAAAVAEAVQALVSQTGQNPCLIVIDTLARNFGGGDENSTQDMNLFIQHVDGLKDRWKATALIVHHTGHGDKSRARGAMALKGALDHEYQIKKDKENIISLQSTKTKDGPDPKPLHFEIITVPLSCNGSDSPIEGATLKQIKGQTQTAGENLSPQKRRAVDLLRTCLDDKGKKRDVKKDGREIFCVTLEEYRKDLKNGNICASDKPDSIRRAISSIVTQLDNEAITVSYGDYIWLPDELDKTGRTRIDTSPKPDGQDESL